MPRLCLGILLALAFGAVPIGAADVSVLGKKLLVRDFVLGSAIGVEVAVTGREASSADVVFGNPATVGATLTVFVHGASSWQLTFAVPGSTAGVPWKTRTGPDGSLLFAHYRDRHGLQGPVKNIDLRSKRGGRLSVRITVKGLLPVAVSVPGADGGMMLALGGGDQVCVTLGASAGGRVTNVRDRFGFSTFRIADAESEVCATPPPPTTTTTTTLPPRGTAGDGWADVIIGKPDFSEFTPYEVAADKVFNPGGVVIDRATSPGAAFVWDSGNSRILGLDLATCYAGPSPCAATLVIGQPAPSDHSACNGDSGFQLYPVRAPASASSLCGIPEDTLSILENKSFVQMAVDAERNLYVPDFYNHRVLRFDSPFTTDTVADAVWGQPDFASNACGAPTAASLCFWSFSVSGAGVALDAGGNLWVADGGDDRVLRFPRDLVTGQIATTADLVLGQRDFTSIVFDTTLDRMRGPAALGFDASGRLYVADAGNFRVLAFDPPFVSGMPATSTFGGVLARPLGLEIAPGGEGVWIFEHDSHLLRLWDLDGVTVKATLTTGDPGGGSIGVDRAGNVLAAVYVYGQDVLRFGRSGTQWAQDRRLFTPPYIYNRPGPRGLRSGLGVEVAAGQLIVADAGRILFWDDPAHLVNGQAADGVVGAPDAYTTSYQPDCCFRIRADAANRLWVLAGSYSPEIRVYQLPLASGAQPIAVLTLPLPVLGGGSVSVTGGYQQFAGIAPVGAGEAVWVSHPATNRVFRIRNPLSTPMVDVILGQTSAAGTLCNRGLVPPPNTGTPLRAAADMLCTPGAVTLDRLGNLFVSDHHLEVEGNWRLLEFDGALFPAGGATPIFAVPASKTFPFDSAQHPLTWEPAFDSSNRMVVGYNAYRAGRFVGIYNDPLGPSTNPDAYLADYGSMPYAAVFDAEDNLYVGDLNRSRVLVYRRPLAGVDGAVGR